MGYKDLYDYAEWHTLIPLSRGDFPVADVAGGTLSFFSMLCNASQKLLKEVRTVHPVGLLGPKMLWSKSAVVSHSRLPFCYDFTSTKDSQGTFAFFTGTMVHWKSGLLVCNRAT